MSRRKKPFMTPWRIVLSLVLGAIIVSLGTWLLLAGKDIPVLNPQGIIAVQQKDLIIFTLILSAIIVIPVFLMLGIFSWKYREGNPNATYTPDIDGNRWLETLWWGIPILIIGILSVVTWVSTHQLDPYKPIASDVKPITVQVIALQWKWLFIYPEQGVASLNELRMPVGTPVNFELTSDGPMSAMWIPSLGSQTYAMTGMSSKLSLRADKVGEYRGSNSNISGSGYADMNFKVIAMPDRKAFDKWAESIDNNKSHRHLEWSSFEELSKQSRADKVTYYHLHDRQLYSKVMAKYMPSGHSDTVTTDQEHAVGATN
ncbi:MAG: Ubiquinol oxidase subunit 2 [Candidatus Saccharibacteria bacterium]|nr:Ubiquinol oxidase subunit 2 [Candidatus Saccharibacteria bacterium]